MERDIRIEKLPITAAVLAGGRSMRMGVDKTLLPFEGTPMVVRVARAAAEVCESVIVVTNRPEAFEGVGLGDDVKIVPDDMPHCGPLGGLATALRMSEQNWVLAVAADMPWLSPEVVRILWRARDGVDAVVPVSEKGVEPLLALYSRTCLEPAREVLLTGRRRIVSFFKNIRVAEVSVEALRMADPDLRTLINVNTPDEMSDALRASAEGRTRAISVMEVDPRRGRRMPVERPITVTLNEREIATMQATPEHLDDLAVGFLIAEGMLSDRDRFSGVESDAKRGMVWISSEEQVPDDIDSKTRYVTSGCGKGVTFASLADARGLERIDSSVRIDAQQVYELMGEMARGADAYRSSGGMHACGLAVDGRLALVREDVGRHNAVDKLLGHAWLEGISTKDAVLLSTGRISYEMAMKAVRAGIPVVVSRTAVTDLAADLAEELGVTLAGYARGGKLTVYTHAERIVSAESTEGNDS